MSGPLFAFTLAMALLTLSAGTVLVFRGLHRCHGGLVVIGALLCMFGAMGVRDLAYEATTRSLGDEGTVLVRIAPAYPDQEAPQ